MVVGESWFTGVYPFSCWARSILTPGAWEHHALSASVWVSFALEACRWDWPTVAGPQSSAPTPSELWIYLYNNSYVFFFLCYSWITDPFPDTKYNKNLHLRSQCTVTFKYARVVLIRQTLVLYHHIINIAHFQFWSSYIYECVNSAAAAPRVSWSSSIECLGNPKYYICCYSWLVYPVFQVWRHKEISDVHIWCFNKVFKSLHIVLQYR